MAGRMSQGTKDQLEYETLNGVASLNGFLFSSIRIYAVNEKSGNRSKRPFIILGIIIGVFVLSTIILSIILVMKSKPTGRKHCFTLVSHGIRLFSYTSV